MKHYIETDKYIHFLSQNLARVNATCLAKKDDDSHTNLSFDPIFRRLSGRWIEIGDSRLLFALDFANSTYVWFDEHFNELESISIAKKTQSELLQDIQQSLEKFAPNAKPFVNDLHFDIPEYGFESKQLTCIPMETTSLWSDFRRFANEACSMVNAALNAHSEIRIWPHHFDTGLHTQVSQDLGIGFGFAMADSISDTPYFYMSGYSESSPVDYSKTPDLLQGHWHTSEHWNGAVLSLDDIDPVCSANQMEMFLQESLRFYLQPK